MSSRPRKAGTVTTLDTPPVPSDPPAGAGATEGAVEAVRAILSAPVGRSSPPVLSSFEQGPFRRYFILEADPDAYRRAWEAYKSVTGSSDAAGFLGIVYGVLNTGIPRMYREVAWVPLD